ncbi:hypothetical protein BGZ73_008138, partial [Actinomortierella ambigua]
ARSEDPVYSLSFKIIIFHLAMIGFYFLPCSSLFLQRILPASVSSELSRTATKPMIELLDSRPMTEGMFGEDPEEATCAICLGDYQAKEPIRFLPCQHHFHQECVDQWLLTDKSCPLCKHDIDRPMLTEHLRRQSTQRQHILGSSAATTSVSTENSSSLFEMGVYLSSLAPSSSSTSPSSLPSQQQQQQQQQTSTLPEVGAPHPAPTSSGVGSQTFHVVIL